MRLLWGDKSGSAVVITAASMPLLIGAAGLATDTIRWTLWKRQLQRAADTGAMAGAYALGQGKTVSSAATAAIAKDSDVGTNTPTVENAPTAGDFAGNPDAVRVIVSASHPLPFSSMFIATPTITAEATAAILTNGKHCVIALEETDTGITIGGTATVDLGCGMATNSKAANAVSASGNSCNTSTGVACVTASPITAVGGLSASDKYTSSTELLPYSLPQSDPFSNLPDPSASDFASCKSELKVTPSDTPDLVEPGCYKGMDLNGTVTLKPGVYFIDGSTNKNFSIGAQANVTGSGVTIILTSSNATNDPAKIATMTINAGATVNLTSPSAGDYKGVLFYQDRLAQYGTVTINGNASSTLEGGIYFPSQKINFLGTAGMNTDCIQIVGLKVEFSGTSKITNDTDDCPIDPAPGFTGAVVRLVA
jgi:hypothetical protein